MNVDAVVLAAGRSVRMGRPKALLGCGETTFLGSILARLASTRARRVRVVLGHAADQIRAAVPMADDVAVVNPAWESGMLSSIRCGVLALPADGDAFLVWPVDHPLASAATVDRLITRFEQTGAAVVLPLHAGQRGHPVLFAARLRDELLSASDAGGARAVVHAHERDRVESIVDDPGVVADIDTPEDLRRWMGTRGLPT